jgi:hypothetical protein
MLRSLECYALVLFSDTTFFHPVTLMGFQVNRHMPVTCIISLGRCFGLATLVITAHTLDRCVQHHS